jgi:hypothetical protein
VNTVAPAVSGTPQPGNTLTTTNGAWTGNPTPTFAQQWQADAVDIPGATGLTYAVQPGDVGKSIRSVVTATNSVGSASANSNTVSIVQAPANTVAPAITGTPTAGQTLTLSNGTWTGTPTPTFTRQWQVETAVNSGLYQDIAGATTTSYIVQSVDQAKRLRGVVSATNSVSTVTATSNLVTAQSPPVNTAAPAITGSPLVGQTLTLTPGTYTGFPVPTLTRQWKLGNAPIPGETGTTYAVKDADNRGVITCEETASNTVNSVVVPSNSVNIQVDIDTAVKVSDIKPKSMFVIGPNRMVSDYIGNTMRFQRVGGDNGFADFGFDVSGRFDLAAFNIWRAGSAVNAIGAYDQLGSGRLILFSGQELFVAADGSQLRAGTTWDPNTGNLIPSNEGSVGFNLTTGFLELTNTGFSTANGLEITLLATTKLRTKGGSAELDPAALNAE